jgi:hypothetical protein
MMWMKMRKTMKQLNIPPGWDEARVRRIIVYYERQNTKEAMIEEAASVCERPAVKGRQCQGPSVSRLQNCRKQK